MVRILIALLGALIVATPAQAKWHEASSDHFVIYADDSERDLRRFAENLERFHSAMEFISQSKTDKPSPSNRVTIYVVGDQRDVRKLAGDKRRTVRGFYIPRAGSSVAFVETIKKAESAGTRRVGSRVKSGTQDTHFSTIILLHEYAHHFLMSSRRQALPRWLNEGAAEFYASARFDKDGTISIGRPANHRAGELFLSRKVPVEQLFDSELYEQKKGKKYDAFYGWSWALFHYLSFSDERSGQLTRYQQELASGTPPVEAARKAFGAFEKLQREVDQYIRQRKMFNYTFPPSKFDVGQISIRTLPEGEAAMMPIRMRSQRGVNRETAREVLTDARRIAAEYPDDPGVQTALAEAEYDAGNDIEAIAAADRAISRDPNRTNAYVQKGFALFRQAKDAEDKTAAYKAAMKPFSALNKIENDHPLPLIYYYRSFVERGAPPTEKAKLALEQAAGLAPFDKGLWFNVGLMQAKEGEIALAKRALTPLANDPHGDRWAGRAATLLDALERVEEGTPFRAPMLIDTPDLNDDGEEQTSTLAAIR